MALGTSTIAMILFFGTNALLYALFYSMKNLSHNGEENPDQTVEKKEKEKIIEKELSKPFNGTPICFYNLTRELFQTGLIMCLTYMCERHWFFEHSTKSYSRDLFMFVCILFFAYGIYTRKPIHDLSLLSREQTEEWKGWMQFIFLLYHYFHAEEVYNSVRVMITCYVWMTGFGNFSFFYLKQDYGWLRVTQMFWRLNFSVLFLMWTHGNTWILYYICPMHTFYFLMVYITMYTYNSVNYSKWEFRYKLLVVGIIIYIIWDINHGIFDFIFGFLGTAKVIGANQGSVWEYYFRTSLDHWSAFLGMIFASNYPLAEQYFKRASGYPLAVCATLMAFASIWWYVKFYTLEKLTYNLYHSYTAIIPLTSYIFFRNITPGVRSVISMSMHDLGKTTLETYLLQHHIWLTSNAKTLLTIVPGHPWVNFAFASCLFYVCSRELYRLTMTLRGMILPDDASIALRNIIGSILVIALCFAFANTLTLLGLNTLLHATLTCCCLFLLSISAISHFGVASVSENNSFQQLSRKAMVYVSASFILGVFALMALSSTNQSLITDPAVTAMSVAAPQGYPGPSSSCFSALSSGKWISNDCSSSVVTDLTSLNSVTRKAFCETIEWSWDAQTPSCPLGHLPASQTQSIFKNKRVVFLGDSLVRNVYHQFNVLLDPINYKPENVSTFLNLKPSSKADLQSQLKHSDLEVTHAALNSTVEFYWTPFVQNITSMFNKPSMSLFKDADYVVCGGMLWNALYFHNIDTYTKLVNGLVASITKGKTIQYTGVSSATGIDLGVVQSKPAIAWIQPTRIIDYRLTTDEKRKYLTEANVERFRNITRNSVLNSLNKLGSIVIETNAVSSGRESGCVDGVHYASEVYSVIAQMTANAFTLRYPSNYVKKDVIKPYAPKPTGSMSFPAYGFYVLLLASVMLFSMDSFLGFGFLSLLLFQKSLDWDSAYAPMIQRAMKNREAMIAAQQQNDATDSPQAAIALTSVSSSHGSSQGAAALDSEKGLLETDQLLQDGRRDN